MDASRKHRVPVKWPTNGFRAVSRENSNMSKAVSISLTVGALVLAFVLNPSPEKHRQKITEAVAARSQLERVLGIGQLTSFVSRYHSFGIGSYSTVNEKVISVGVFGMVFVAD